MRRGACCELRPDWHEPDTHAGQFHRFYDAVCNPGELPVALGDARASLELITAMYFSGQTHASVTLPIGADHPNYSNWLPAHVFAG